MVCVKDTATWPRLTLVSRLPSVCTAASGSTDTICKATLVARERYVAMLAKPD